MHPLLCLLAQLYQREHELLRELVHVDSALDDHERRSEVRNELQFRIFLLRRHLGCKQKVVEGSWPMFSARAVVSLTFYPEDLLQ